MSGWKQAPVSPRQPACLHIGLVAATLSLYRHDYGHEWVCTCGEVFHVASTYDAEVGMSRKTLRKGPA